ncbi:hypothetical protein K8S17_03825 [bacterium]|nr:hypothetical protein [bacterium]
MHPRQAFIVSHTHWDREWYLTFHEFRVNLVRVVEGVLDALESDDEFRCFVLDGQAVVLEDYLEVRPDDEERVRELVRGGALIIGPWYELPDEFLVSAESHVRNLLIGHRVCSRFGPVQSVGYVPDSFGHIAQMPQLLRRAGIDSFIYWRGNGDELEHLGLEYIWRAPDGSEVTAINQLDGYCNAAGLGFEEIWHAHTRREVDLALAVKKVGELFERMGERSNGDVYLLSNGCDHFPRQQRFGDVLAALREAFSGTEFVHAGFAEYVEAVRAGGFATRRYTGELLGGRYSHILSGVWSARMPLKQMNDRAQLMFSDMLEPVSAYTHFVLGQDYPLGEVEYAWKLLLKNHPHDSICGCSTDDVHRDMMPRFRGVLETSGRLLTNALDGIVPTFARRQEDDGETAVCVMNPLPFRRTEVVRRMVVLQPSDIDPATLRFYSEARREVPFTVVDEVYVERFWGIDYRGLLSYEAQREQFDVYREYFGRRSMRSEWEHDTADCFLTIEFEAVDLPALGHAVYFLTDGGPASADAGGRTLVRSDGRSTCETDAVVAEGTGSLRSTAAAVTIDGDRVRNEFIEVRLHPNGTFDLTELGSGAVCAGLNLLEDVEDIGDEYDHSPCVHTRTFTSSGCEGGVEAVESTGFRGSLEATFSLMLPARIAADRSARSKESVECGVRVSVAITKGSPLVDVQLEFENAAEDHRLRAVFPTRVSTDTVTSDGHFMLNERPIDRVDRPDWVQAPPATLPQQEYSLVTDGQRGLAVLNRGLPEIEASRDADGCAVLSLTLLRCVGWLSRDDFPTRRSQNAGPTLFTPEAQCPGHHVFRYAVTPVEGRALASGLPRLSSRYRVPPLTRQGVEDGMLEGGHSFLSAENGFVKITAVKRHGERDTLVVRLCNLAGEPSEELLTLGRRVSSAWRVNLLEERGEELAVRGSFQIPLTLGPHEIVTVEIGFSGDDA